MAVPKPFRLFIPRKTQKPVDQPDYGTDMRAIEAWALALVDYVDSISSGGYASLTGPGQTTSPGDLTQNGALTVNGYIYTHHIQSDATNAGIDMVDNSTGGAGIVIEEQSATPGVDLKIIADNNKIFITAVVDKILISAGGNTEVTSGAFIVDTDLLVGTSGTGVFEADFTSSKLSFYGATLQLQPTVTGSRGGNAALASLLTSLNNLGLIQNSTTP